MKINYELARIRLGLSEEFTAEEFANALKAAICDSNGHIDEILYKEFLNDVKLEDCNVIIVGNPRYNITDENAAVVDIDGLIDGSIMLNPNLDTIDFYDVYKDYEEPLISKKTQLREKREMRQMSVKMGQKCYKSYASKGALKRYNRSR